MQTSFSSALCHPGKRLEQLLGGLLKCLSIVSCHKVGSKELKNKGEWRDFASNFVSLSIIGHEFSMTAIVR